VLPCSDRGRTVLGIKLSAHVLVFDYPTHRRCLTAYSRPLVGLASAQQAQRARALRLQQGGVAVTGLLRLQGAPTTPRTYWSLLHSGHPTRRGRSATIARAHSTASFDRDRHAPAVAEPLTGGFCATSSGQSTTRISSESRQGGSLPRPQAALLLECNWKRGENAGLSTGGAGSTRTASKRISRQ